MTGFLVQAKLQLALDEQLSVLSADDCIERLLGFSAEDFIASRVNLKDRIHSGDADIAARLFCPQTEEKSGVFNIRLRHADGRIRCIRGQYTKEPEPHGGTAVLRLLLEDARSLYAQSDEPAELTAIEPMMNVVGESLYFKNRNHVFTAANRQALQYFSNTGGDDDGLLGKTDYDLFAEKFADANYRIEKELFAGAPAASQIQEIQPKDGKKRYANNHRYAVKDKDEQIIGMFGVVHDTTEQVETLDRLHKSEESLKETERIAGLGSYLLDFSAGLWTSSDVMDLLFGIGKDYERTVEGWAALVHPNDRARMVAYFANEVVGQGKPFDNEYRIVRHSDGVVRWVHGQGRLEFDGHGQPAKMFGLIRDITERKQSEIALRESKELLQLFIEHAPAGMAMLDREMRYLATSRQWLVMHSLLGQELIGRSHYDVIPEIPEHWREEHRHALAGQPVPTDERLLERANGSQQWIKREVIPWRTGDGAIGGIILCVEDITWQKIAEEKLRESKDLLQLFLDNTPVALAMFDRDMRYLAVSQPWARDHALPDREIIGRSHYEINPDVPERWKETHRRGLAGERQRSEEDQYDRADGTVQWIRWEIIPWRTGDGAIGGIVMFYEDITARRQADAALRENKELLQLFIAHAPAALAMFDRDMHYLVASRRWLEEYGIAEGEILGRPHYEVVPDIPERWKEIHRRGMAGETLRGDQDRFERDDGTVQWIRWEVIPWRTGDGAVGGIILFAEDITQQMEVEERLRLAASVFTNAREGITITDPNGTILEVNEMFTRITGYSREEALGQNPRLLKSGLQSEEFYANMWRSLVQEGQWSGEIWNRTKSGDIVAEMLTINAVRDANGNLLQYVALFSDITELKQHEQQLEHVTHYDVLTSLPNRALLADRLNQAMAQAKRRKQIVAVAYLDLDGFKRINDDHGHEAGDRLLTSLAFDMKCALREGDTLARLGGDEFVAVMIDLDNTEASVPVLARLLDAAAEQVQVGNLSLRVSASIGVTFYPQPEDADADLLLRQADQAMYQAKLAGGSRYHIFDPDHDQTVRGRHENLEHIRHALAAREFVLYYQPKVNMRTGKVVGAEALIRWQHPERGLLPPGMFLPVIEDHALAIEVGEWVIDTALAQMESWSAAGLDIPVSVNVGAMQLQQTDFVDSLSKLLEAHPSVKPFSLEIEVLETSALQDIAQTSQVLSACQSIGVSFALDDFGTGYSSLTYLKRLPASILKIDQSFVSDMLEDPENLNILEGILGLASAFHRQVIAEGVETVEHGVMLLRLGCDLAQGYGIARPMPAGDLSGWISGWTPDPRWVEVPQVHSGNRALLSACVEHRAWLAAFEAFLQGKRHAPPVLDQRQCRFGAWLEDESQAGRGQNAAYRSVDTVHRRFHELASSIVASQALGESSDGIGRLGELHSMGDDLQEQLDTLMQWC